MNNMPVVKLGIIAVSRDCFPRTLSESRRKAVVAAYKGDLYECPTIVENEVHMMKALEEVKAAGCNALVVYLGNFGPENPETLIARYFDGPVMFVAAAEENTEVLLDDRGDAYCGMLNCSYNLDIRGLKGYIPEQPVGTPAEIAERMAEFIPIARTLIGLSKLKIITFGPRPWDFLACNAPIKRLYDLGVEIQENSELDLFQAYKQHEGDERIPGVIEEMANELAEGNKMAGILPRLAQLQITLMDWAEANRGASEYFVFANKCWPAFESAFGCVPCYVNSFMAGRGIPISCEVDIWGALSEYIGQCVSDDMVTLLDINNTVPQDMYDRDIKGKYDYKLSDTFMGFHCGNTNIAKLAFGEMKFQKIQKRTLEPDGEPDITRGTLEGDLAPGDITFFRLQSTADTQLKAYVAEGEILPVRTCSFGGIGVFAIPEMGRFYRHVLVAKHYPHHGAVAFGHYGKLIFEVFKLLGVTDIGFNQPKGMLYKTENPFA